MLYIGNFSYNDDTDSKDNYCLMPIVVEAETTRRSASHSSSVSPLPASARSRDARPGPACAIERTSCFQSMCASVLSREGW